MHHRFARGFAYARDLLQRVPRSAERMVEAPEDVLACRPFPTSHCHKMRSAILLVRVHQENKRCTRLVGIFPNAAAISRLLGASLSHKPSTGSWRISPHCRTSTPEQGNTKLNRAAVPLQGCAALIAARRPELKPVASEYQTVSTTHPGSKYARSKKRLYRSIVLIHSRRTGSIYVSSKESDSGCLCISL